MQKLLSLAIMLNIFSYNLAMEPEKESAEGKLEILIIKKPEDSNLFEQEEAKKILILDALWGDKCGICKKAVGEETNVFWPSPDYYLAHKECYEFIIDVEKPLREVLKKKYPDDGLRSIIQKQNNEHEKVIEQIEKQISGRASSIREFIERNGTKEIKELFLSAANLLHKQL